MSYWSTARLWTPLLNSSLLTPSIILVSSSKCLCFSWKVWVPGLLGLFIYRQLCGAWILRDMQLPPLRLTCLISCLLAWPIHGCCWSRMLLRTVLSFWLPLVNSSPFPLDSLRPSHWRSETLYFLCTLFLRGSNDKDSWFLKCEVLNFVVV